MALLQSAKIGSYCILFLHHDNDMIIAMYAESLQMRSIIPLDWIRTV
jgi:hypothetical protein